jgi:hypothetical protein
MIDIDIRFEVDGDDVSADELGADFEKAAFESIREHVVGVVQEVRCPEHGEAVRAITFQGGDMDTLKFEVGGCCDALKDAVREAFE